MKSTWIPSGYILVAGPANTGKSSLFNAITGSGISPVNSHPHTTRFPITGIYNTRASQACFVDMPPLETGTETDPRWTSVCDAVILVLDARRYNRDFELSIVQDFMQTVTGKPLMVALGHGDHLPVNLRAALALQASLEINSDGVVTVCPPMRVGVQKLRSMAMSALPLREKLFPEGITSLNSGRFLASQAIRSVLGTVLSEELAGMTAVQIEEYSTRNRKLYVRVNLLVARSSDKGTVIGRKGQTLTRIQQETESVLTELTDLPVQSEVWVKVREGWPDNRADLLEFGYAN
ncbi:MAG: GTPase [Candidatus Fermentibacteraceae bacterium]